MSDLKHVRNVLYENLAFQKKKLNSPVKDWEESMRIRIQDKISGLEEADAILKALQQGRIIVIPENHGTLDTLNHKFNLATAEWERIEKPEKS